MTKEELDRRQIAHWRATERTNNFLKWILTTFGLAFIGAVFTVGLAFKQIAINSDEVATLRADAKSMSAQIASAVSEIRIARFEIQAATSEFRSREDGPRH